MKDSPNLIFIPEVFDQVESWLQFFSNPLNKVIQQRNVYIVYPRNFGNSDRNPGMDWESHANDVMRFMYQHEISMATLAGHGLGGKIALATAAYHYDKVTGYCGIDTVPTNQYYYQPFHELRSYIEDLKVLSLQRPYSSIVNDLRRIIRCPKWRSIFEQNLVKGSSGYEWRFEHNAVFHNLNHKIISIP